MEGTQAADVVDAVETRIDDICDKFDSVSTAAFQRIEAVAESAIEELGLSLRRADSAIMVLAICLLMAVATVIFFATRPAAPALSSEAASIKAQGDTNVAMQKRVTELEILVVKSCVDKGNIPIWMNGNIDCRPQPK